MRSAMFRALSCSFADQGQLEPVLVGQRMRREADRQRVQRIDGPIGAGRLAENVGVEQVGDPLGHLALA